MLGVSLGASEEEIQAAYRRRARDCHPDLRPDNPGAAAEFRRVSEAYAQLRTKPADKPSGAAAEAPDELDIKDVVDRAFGQSRPRQHRRTSSAAPPPRRAHSRAGALGPSFIVPFEAAILGGDHVLEVPGHRGVGTRKLKISLPPGVEPDDMFRIKGEIMRALIAEHPYFTRDGHDVLITVPLTIAEITFGATVRVPTVNGTVELTVPARTKPGRRLRLKGKGVPGKGDQHCVIGLVPPDPADADVRAAIEALHRRERLSPRPWDPKGTRTGVKGLDS